MIILAGLREKFCRSSLTLSWMTTSEDGGKRLQQEGLGRILPRQKRTNLILVNT